VSALENELAKARAARMGSDAPSLFDVLPRDPLIPRVGPSHHNDPETAREAARRDLPRKGTQRARVLDAFRELGETGATDYELGRRLEMFRWVAGTRRGELIEDGWLIVDSGERRVTDTGSRAIVWRLSEVSA
jgi:hypothetical protein